MKYRKKPVVIEAFQMTKERRWSNEDWPEWLHAAWQADYGAVGSLYCRPGGGEELFVGTLEGEHTVTWDDWIIRGVKGELYPCKPDIFEATYDAAEEPEEGPGTVTVRVAVAVDPSGDYAAGGWSGGEAWEDQDYILDNLENGEARYWLTAELALPSPPLEVEASVEEVRLVEDSTLRQAVQFLSVNHPEAAEALSSCVRRKASVEEVRDVQ